MGDVVYRKRGKIRWAKHSRFSWFLSLPRKFFHEFFSYTEVMNTGGHCTAKSISAKNFIGLKPRMFSPANLSLFTVYS